MNSMVEKVLRGTHLKTSLLGFALLALSLVPGSGCRVFRRTVSVGDMDAPPRILLPSEPSFEQRQAAEELAAWLNQAYGFGLRPEIVSEYPDANTEEAFLFLVGMAPGSQFDLAAGNSLRYRIDGDRVYFHAGQGGGLDGRSQADSDLSLAVYRFLTREMGFRWFSPNPRDRYFPPVPRRLPKSLSYGFAPVFITVRRDLSDLSAFKDSIPENLAWSDRQRGKTGERRRLWLRRLGVVVREAEEPGAGTANMAAGARPLQGARDIEDRVCREYFFPGDEAAWFADFKSGGGETTAVAPGCFDWGLSGFADYGGIRSLLNPDLDFDQLLDEFTEGLGAAKKPVREYFDFWRQAAQAWRQSVGEGAVAGRFPAFYTEEKLRESGRLLLRAQAVPGLSGAARHRIESWRIGHEHLAGAFRAWKSLKKAGGADDLQAAWQLQEELMQMRRQMVGLLDFEPARLVARELARGDLLGWEFRRLATGLTPQLKFQGWRYRVESGEDEAGQAWSAPEPEGLDQWSKVQPQFKLDAGQAAWLVGVSQESISEDRRERARLLVWGLPCRSAVYFNGNLLRANDEMDAVVARHSVSFRLAEDDFREGARQVVAIRIADPCRFAPVRAAWLMSEQEE